MTGAATEPIRNELRVTVMDTDTINFNKVRLGNHQLALKEVGENNVFLKKR